MNVSTEDIRNIRPGAIQPFIGLSALEMNSACTKVTRLKRVGTPEGVVDYETQKFYDLHLLLVRAMRDGDTKVLNR